MADTKISALTAATAAAGANELAINEAGASKKVTVRQIEEFVHDKGADVASAATTTLGDGHYFHITGTTTITDIDFTNSWDGKFAILHFEDILTLTHNATTLVIPGAVSIVTAAGDKCGVVVDSGDNVHVVFYQRAATWPVGQPRVNRLASDHSISSTTATEVTGLSRTLEIGTYTFKYTLVVRSDTTTVGLGLGVNFTGTANRRVWSRRFVDSGASAAAGQVDDASGNVHTIVAGYAEKSFFTTAPPVNTAGVTTIASDCMMIIEGLLDVSVAGDIELWHSSETATATSVMTSSSLVVIRTA